MGPFFRCGLGSLIKLPDTRKGDLFYSQAIRDPRGSSVPLRFAVKNFCGYSDCYHCCDCYDRYGYSAYFDGCHHHDHYERLL